MKEKVKKETFREQIARIEAEQAAKKAAAKELDAQGIVYCPKCLSQQVAANKKGFGVGKALTGAILTGGIGLLAGGIGARKVEITCLKCGNRWKAGK